MSKICFHFYKLAALSWEIDVRSNSDLFAVRESEAWRRWMHGLQLQCGLHTILTLLCYAGIRVNHFEDWGGRTSFSTNTVDGCTYLYEMFSRIFEIVFLMTVGADKVNAEEYPCTQGFRYSELQWKLVIIYWLKRGVLSLSCFVCCSMWLRSSETRSCSDFFFIWYLIKF